MEISFHSCHFVIIEILNQVSTCNVQYIYIMKVTYRIAPSKSLVGVDGPIFALS